MQYKLKIKLSAKLDIPASSYDHGDNIDTMIG